MNQAVKSHWKLAFRTFKKAVKVTFQTLSAMARSKKHSFKIEENLHKSRNEMKVMLDLEDRGTKMLFPEMKDR